jgi:hypothetical protein
MCVGLTKGMEGMVRESSLTGACLPYDWHMYGDMRISHIRDWSHAIIYHVIQPGRSCKGWWEVL